MLKYFNYFVNLIMLITLVASASQKRSGQIVIIKRLGQCTGRNDLAVFVPEAKIIQKSKNNYVINGEVIMRDQFPPDLKGYRGVIDLKKCEDPMHEDSCVSIINKIQSTNLCDFFESQNSVFRTFTKHLDPDCKCPIKNITYTLNEVPVDMNFVNFLPVVLNSNYDITLLAYKNTEMKACIKLNVAVRSRRS